MDIEQLQQLAERGDPGACMQLGHRLMRGRGIQRDYERAMACFDRAARAGDVDALYLMGKYYLKGIGCTRDEAGAVSCLEQAARRGHAGAALKLGSCFAHGTGAPQNAELAAYWYRKAIVLGESRAYDALLQLSRDSVSQNPSPRTD